MSKDIPMNSEILDELNWIRIQNKLVNTESFMEKFQRKIKENPVIPIGVLATTSALVCGLYSFYKGNSWMSQYMMRARVAAQGFTILSTAVGFMIISNREQK